MIKPGVYTEVRSEGITGTGVISVGTVGIVGTARKGAMDTAITVSTINQALSLFSTYDVYNSASEGSELTLVRALEQLFNNGAGTVIAVRVGDSNEAKGTQNVVSSSGNCCAISAANEGTWGNLVETEVIASTQDALVSEEALTGVTADQSATWWELEHGSANSPMVDARTVIRVVTTTGTELTYTITWTVTGGGAAPNAGEVNIESKDATNPGRLWFNAGEIPASASTIYATYLCGATDCVKVTVTDTDTGTIEEYYTPCGDNLSSQITDSSALLTAVPDATYPHEKPTAYTGAKRLSGGANGAAVTATHVSAGLTVLETETVNIVVIPYAVSAAATTFYDGLLAHITTTSSQRRERIGVIGHIYADDTVSEVKTTAAKVAEDNGRIVLVSPGIKMTNRVTGNSETVGAPYTAAGVAGLIASLDPEASPTNKTISGSELQVKWNYGEQEQLIENRVFCIEEMNGLRVVKGITASTATAWAQITTRRIVDFCLTGTRSAAQNFIGRLNNSRVRNACKSTIDGFLARMVKEEMISSEYSLSVTATRAEETAGIAYIDMKIQPVFSIDYIRVIMKLE